MDRQQSKFVVTGSVQKFPATVLGCLRPGYLAVALSDGVGLADGGVSHEIAMDSIPSDLRVPNSKFVVVMNWMTGEVIAVERRESEK